MMCHQTASGFWMENQPLGSPRAKLLCQEHALQSPAQLPRAGDGEHPPPTLQPACPREQGDPGVLLEPPPPPGGFEGALGAWTGMAVGSRCARW